MFAGWYTTSYKKKVIGIDHGTTGDTAVYAMWKTDPKYVYLKYAKVKK
ncbi:hypothetical protein H8700_02360 [Lachnospiraceae bacterium BX3]|uniref:Uncharacterized protein n=1 Tax=Jutongia hominis TaxID=2763664 RepID=A0ABR7MSC4_9FIRM|nr:hypothetical protein [Jutongia hominis]